MPAKPTSEPQEGAASPADEAGRRDAPRYLPEDAPGPAREGTPRHAPEDTPRHAREDTPRHAREDAPGHAREGTPRHAREDTPRHAPKDVPAEAVTPLIRGIAVLRELTEANGTLSLSGLERATGLARSTVDRITATLARMGYVRFDGRDVHLSPRLMELGNAYLSALRLPALLAPQADALADELDESVSLAVADLDGIRFIHQATRRRAMSLSFRIGDLLPAERTAPGPLFATEWTDTDWQRWRQRRAADPRDLSFTAVPPRTYGADERDAETFVRRTQEASVNGWSLDDQLIEPGLVAISVPVRAPGTEGTPGRDGRVAAPGTDPTHGTDATITAPGTDDTITAPGTDDTIAAPGTNSKIACVASVVSHTSRHSAQRLRTALLPRLRSAVRAMERELRATPPPEPGPPPSDLARWTGTSKQQLGREFVESLARGLTVVTAFGEDRPELTLTEVARATGLARATARRALITYEHLGLVAWTGRTFTLTPRILSLGFPPLSRTSLPEIAQPHLADLTSRIHESTSLAVLSESGEEIQYTARVATARVMSVNITVGTRLPAYATALGRVLLADAPGPLPGPANLPALTPHTIKDKQTLEQTLAVVRSQGYALVDEELEEGLRSLAVPIRDRSGRVVAALNTAMHASRRTPRECVTDLLPELTRTATRIQTDLHTASRYTRVPPT
ncbi:IclR family transcriptional regulator domain-containing protein [Streptomyces indiaensis]|uniref:IclR family transcriptional regulator C-terminal domain-containing protein n=1 Tax=Streptomyces indiaensis TaxID=284033 RepID=A0ABN3D5L6_9ACTN|nr:IclR family transcriptional regulator C-terminal domain-containing protein [Streptomyces indiaensis]MCF1649817.1 helix-turn-helix domain-containing protein [Streptomyces indiaensis]